MRGPGVVIAPAGGADIFDLPGVTFVNEDRVTIAGLGAGIIPPDTVWAVWIGRSSPSASQILDRAAMAGREDWSAVLADPEQPVRRKVRAAYQLQTGSWHAPEDAPWRWAGGDEALDLALVGAVAEVPLHLSAYLGRLQAETGIERELYLLRSFPLAHPDLPQGSLKVDSVEPLLDFLPSAASMLKLSGAAKTNAEAAGRLGIAAVTVKREGPGKDENTARWERIFGPNED